MKATALLRAVGHVPISETSPSRPAQPPYVASRRSAGPQQTTWHAGWVVVAGRSRAIGRPENARPCLSSGSPG